MGLVAKLESDRQQTLLALTNEIEKARQLKEVLDKEKENRLQLLPELVQAGEHVLLAVYSPKDCYVL